MKLHNVSRAAAFALVTGGLAVSAVPTVAQTTGQSQEQQVKTDWSDEKLDSFAAASIAVNEMQQKWRTRIEQAEGEQERQEIRQKAIQAIQQAIKDQGLSPKEYNRIYQAAQQDRELYEDLLERIQNQRS